MSASATDLIYKRSITKGEVSTIFQFKHLDRSLYLLRAPRATTPIRINMRNIIIRGIFFFLQNYPVAEAPTIELKLQGLVRGGAVDLIDGLCPVGYVQLVVDTVDMLLYGSRGNP